MSKFSLKKSVDPKVAEAAIERYYEKATLNPEKPFPYAIPATELYKDELELHPIKKAWLAVSDKKMEATFFGTALAGIPISLMAVSPLVSTLFSGDIFLTVSMAFVLTFSGSILPLGFADDKRKARRNELQRISLAHNSKALHNAIIRWAKARYQIDLTLESVERAVVAKNQNIVETTSGELYRMDATDSGQFVLGFAKATEESEYQVYKELARKAKELEEKDAQRPTGELPHTKQLLELEYLEA